MWTRSLAMLSLLAASLTAYSERTEPDPGTPATFGFVNGPASPGNSGIFRGQDGSFAIIAGLRDRMSCRDWSPEHHRRAVQWPGRVRSG
jgi:hypothetical protein